MHLGEDHYLTTLLLKHFLNIKTQFVRDAHAYTVAPDDLVHMPKLASNVLLIHELVLSGWVFSTFSAKEALRSLSFTIIFSLLNYNKRVLMT